MTVGVHIGGLGKRLYGYSSADAVICGPFGAPSDSRSAFPVPLHSVVSIASMERLTMRLTGYLRADNREHAMAKVRVIHPDCVFFGKQPIEDEVVEGSEVLSNV